MKHKILNAVMGIFILSFTACDLNEDPLSEYSEITLGAKEEGSGIKYQTKAEIQAAYQGLYNGLLGGGQSLWGLDGIMIAATRSDNAYSTELTNIETTPFETNSLDAGNSVNSRDWNDYFGTVAKTNDVIVNIDSVPAIAISDAERKQWKAEAMIYRAMLWLDAVRFWGNIPLVTQLPGDITAENITEVFPLYYPKQQDAVTVYNQIVSDLKDAVQYAPDNNAADKMRFSKTVARALLAKAYAEEPIRNNDEVIKYADQVLADGIQLADKYEDLFGVIYADNGKATAPIMRNNKETIFEIQFTDGNWITTLFGRDESQMEDDGSFTWAKWAVPSQDLSAAFNAAGDMVRKNQSIKIIPSPWSHRYPSQTYPYAYKVRSKFNSLIKMRGADIMLLKAEALARKGDLAAATAIVNQVRQRVQLAAVATPSSESAMIDVILNERRLELAFEGQRFFDLVRNNRLVQVMNSLNNRDDERLPQAKAFTEDLKLFPIPQNALDENENLVQNPGY